MCPGEMFARLRGTQPSVCDTRRHLHVFRVVHTRNVKTVTLDDEAYRLLRGAKVRRGDSFSDVVRRHFKGPGSEWIQATAGVWSEMTDDDVEQMRRAARSGFERPEWD